MVSEEMQFVAPPHRTENGLSSHMMFQDEGLRFSRPGDDHTAAAGAPVRKPRAVASPGLVMNHEKPLFSLDREGVFFRPQGIELQRSIYGSSCRTGRDHLAENQEWNAEGSNGTPSGDLSDGREDEEDEDEEDDEEDDVDDGDGEVEGLVPVDNGNAKNHNNSSGSVQSTSEKIHTEKANFLEHHSPFGTSRGVMLKDGNNGIRGDLNEQFHQQGRMGHYENAVAITEPDMYYTQILQVGDGSAIAQKEVGGDNGSIFNGRKDSALSVDTGDSIRAHLSDPVTGTLMDDAMILSCGHSFGSNGIQHVIRMKACFKCGHSIPEDSVRPNLALRSAVQAFRREEESQSSKASKRRRERFEQDKCNYEDPFPVDLPRGKGVQFPFVVSDRVLIKGNKRTPQRFVGRVAVVTTQCLNGWYVVKTLDNAESVKLQYRSLAKVPDDLPSNMISSKAMTPNWL